MQQFSDFVPFSRHIGPFRCARPYRSSPDRHFLVNSAFLLESFSSTVLSDAELRAGVRATELRALRETPKEGSPRGLVFTKLTSLLR
jgi:hypothetical protein